MGQPKGTDTFGAAGRAKSLATKRKKREAQKDAYPVALLKHHGNRFRAAKAIGSSRRQVDVWIAEDDEFRAAVEDVWESVKDDLETRLIDIGFGRAKGNVGALCAVLNARAKDRGYGINRQEWTGKDGGPLRHAIDELPEEALRAIAGRSNRGTGETPAD